MRYPTGQWIEHRVFVAKLWLINLTSETKTVEPPQIKLMVDGNRTTDRRQNFVTLPRRTCRKLAPALEMTKCGHSFGAPVKLHGRRRHLLQHLLKGGLIRPHERVRSGSCG